MQPTVAVLEYHLVGYARIWRSTVVSSLAMPVLYLLGIGAAVGQYVDHTGLLATPYVQFVAPGILGFTALKVALDESTFPVLTSFQYQKTYFAMAMTPVRASHMVLGRLAYIAVRICVASAAFLAAALAAGAISSPLAVLSIPIGVLAGIAIAAPGFACAASVRSAGPMAIVVRVGWLPMTLLSGVFFPIQQLPVALQAVAYATPLWHGVELSRAAATGAGSAWSLLAHVAVLLLWCVGGVFAAEARFARRLAL